MAYVRMFDSMAELGKLSQGKPTVIPPELIAAIAIDRIRDLEKERRSNDAVDELERLYEL